jgi:hypothetical protein
VVNGAERAAPAQQRVDERGLAVIDVRDDRDVSSKRVRNLLRASV